MSGFTFLLIMQINKDKIICEFVAQEHLLFFFWSVQLKRLYLQKYQEQRNGSGTGPTLMLFSKKKLPTFFSLLHNVNYERKTTSMESYDFKSHTKI